MKEDSFTEIAKKKNKKEEKDEDGCSANEYKESFVVNERKMMVRNEKEKILHTKHKWIGQNIDHKSCKPECYGDWKEDNQS